MSHALEARWTFFLSNISLYYYSQPFLGGELSSLSTFTGH